MSSLSLQIGLFYAYSQCAKGDWCFILDAGYGETKGRRENYSQ